MRSNVDIQSVLLLPPIRLKLKGVDDGASKIGIVSTAFGRVSSRLRPASEPGLHQIT